MALAFVFAWLAQIVPGVGDKLVAATLDRMQQWEVYLQEKMTEMLLQIEEQNRMGMQALLFAAVSYWKIVSVLCLFILLFWFMWKMHKKFRRVQGNNDEESSSSEEEHHDEEQQEQEEEEVVEQEEEDQSLFHPDALRQIQNYQDEREQIQGLMNQLIKLSQIVMTNTFYPVPKYPIAVGSACEGWHSLEEEPVFCLLVPLTAPCGHVFHLELGTPEELPVRNSRIHVELECMCGREEEMGTLCFLHTSADERRGQQPSLLDSLCTGSYLDVQKTVCWFMELIKKAWKYMPGSAACSMDVMPSRRLGRLQLTDYSERTFLIEIVLGVQQGNTDIFLSSQETEGALTPSTSWPQSCAVAEAKFFKYIAAHAGEDNSHLRYMQVCAYILVGYSFSTYDLKTVFMHLLTTIPLESWRGRYFLMRMDDIFRYLRRCLGKKRLDHFLMGNEAVPAEIILPRDFQVSRPLNLFQHLAQDPDKHQQALQELEELKVRFARLLMDGQ